MDDDAVEVRWVVSTVVGKFNDDIGSPYIKLNCGTVVGGSCWLSGTRLDPRLERSGAFEIGCVRLSSSLIRFDLRGVPIGSSGTSDMSIGIADMLRDCSALLLSTIPSALPNWLRTCGTSAEAIKFT